MTCADAHTQGLCERAGAATLHLVVLQNDLPTAHLGHELEELAVLELGVLGCREGSQPASWCPPWLLGMCGYPACTPGPVI